MSNEKQSKPSESGGRSAPAGDSRNDGGAGEERPPESAENFEHTLRRLIAARDRARRG